MTMKSAKEMFAELGYERDDRYADRIIYYDSDYRVVFNLVSRGYMFGDHSYVVMLTLNYIKPLLNRWKN